MKEVKVEMTKKKCRICWQNILIVDMKFRTVL